ncbi:MAG: tetratricopeptide repeat protein, partial [Selenomonadaceae bacterium]|nr:tetratricopeptide repeat protein [Selenomonadaceae bacterium]
TVRPSVEPAKLQSTVKPTADDFGTLDEILDKAYSERDKGHIWQAIELYRKALERYRADEYAPFVAIDLGNIYKEQALYAKAIKTYEDALNLPAVRRNATVKKDFLNNLRYLRIVRDVLIKHRASSTPFTKLPKPILREIDAEFSRMQLNPAQSK